MSADFIRSRFNNSALNEAVRQERQLSYFTESTTQQDYVSPEFLTSWANRKYETSDYFLNFIKSIFKTENFLTFFKFLRFPLPSSKIINNRILPDLRRVFEAEDSCFDYKVQGIENSKFLSDLDSETFNKDIFECFVHAHNSIVLTSLSPDKENTPIRMIIPVGQVVSIQGHKNKIIRIAIRANVLTEQGVKPGYLYIDQDQYISYNEDFEMIGSPAPHDLGYCPAHWVSSRAFGKNDIVRISIFSFIREELEEYVLLKTLQKMTEPNGSIPVVTYPKTGKKNQNPDFKSEDSEPGGSEAMASQRAAVQSNVTSSQGLLQTGTTIAVAAGTKTDGTVDMDMVKGYINFHYLPVDAMEYIKTRIQEVERSIVTTIVGDVTESRESAKNEMQIRKSVIVLENTLRKLAGDFSRIRKLSDTDYLGLRFGISRVLEVTTFYGTDFFLESEDELYQDFQTAPNPIERKNILIKITESRYRNNPEKLTRQIILNNLLPFISDMDFDKAIARGVDPVVFELQNRFNYWIQQFESEYGDITEFFNILGDIQQSEKFRLINNLLNTLIQNGNGSTESVPGNQAPV